MTGQYSMSLNQSKKEMNMKIVGNFTPEQAQKFIKDYNSKINSMSPSDFKLRIDARELNVVTPELVPDLENCYKLYKSSGFEKIIIEINKAPIVKMQLGRIARQVGLSNAEIVEIG